MKLVIKLGHEYFVDEDVYSFLFIAACFDIVKMPSIVGALLHPFELPEWKSLYMGSNGFKLKTYKSIHTAVESRSDLKFDVFWVKLDGGFNGDLDNV